MKYSVNKGLRKVGHFNSSFFTALLIFTKTYINYDKKRHNTSFCDRVVLDKWGNTLKKEVILVQKMIYFLMGCFLAFLSTGCTASNVVENDSFADNTNPSSVGSFDHCAPSVSEESDMKNEMIEFSSDASWESEPVFIYNDHWTFFVEETPTEDKENYPRGFLSRLMVRDETSGEILNLTGSFYADLPNYKLYAFTDILDSDGIVFEYSAGNASAPVLFFGVGEDIELLVEGDGSVYTGDLDGDGVTEVIWSTIGAFPFTYISWLGEQGTVVSASLDEAVKGELIQSKTINSQISSLFLEIRNGNSAIARWQEESDDDYSSAEVDLSEVLKRLKNNSL